MFHCNICNKNYASNSSLWNHNNKYYKVKILIYNNSDKISKDLVRALGSTLKAKLSEAIVLDSSFNGLKKFMEV